MLVIMRIQVVLEPNQERDEQSFDLSDVGVNEMEWNEMSEEEKHSVLYEVVADNICGIITSFKEN